MDCSRGMSPLMDYLYSFIYNLVPTSHKNKKALFYKKYSAGCDVWSFGMVMFEIWSLGHKPFPMMTVQEVNTHTVYRLQSHPTWTILDLRHYLGCPCT